MLTLAIENKKDPAETGYHEPVLVAEVRDLLRPARGKIYFDGTAGGGGHTLILLRAGAKVIAADRDPAALEEVRRSSIDFGSALTLLRTNFADASRRIRELGLNDLDGILLDLGISSHQVDTGARGFSFQQDGPLDMRMGPDAPQKAADLVNFAPEEELVRIFFEYGEEPFARRIASVIIRRREQRQFQTTAELVSVVQEVVPRRGPKNPATRVFQALRIAVNDELGNLERALPELVGLLKIGGRLAVITFHSLEDRIVKRFFRDVSREWLDRPEWPEPRRNPAYGFRLLTTRPVEPTQSEKAKNARARSAKLRVIERTQYESKS